MNINKIVLILLVMSIAPIIGAQEDTDINALISTHDLNNDGIVILSVSDNENGAVMIHYNVYTGAHEYRVQRTNDPEPQVPGLTVITVLLMIGSAYLIYRDDKDDNR